MKNNENEREKKIAGKNAEGFAGDPASFVLEKIVHRPGTGGLIARRTGEAKVNGLAGLICSRKRKFRRIGGLKRFIATTLIIKTINIRS